MTRAFLDTGHLFSVLSATRHGLTSRDNAREPNLTPTTSLLITKERLAKWG